MEQKTKSLKMLRQRKMLLVLPLLTLPFITAIFLALGGGKKETQKTETVEMAGFNTELPDPHFKDDIPWDKMHYYEQAALDSLKRDELIRKDPNYLSSAVGPDSTAVAGQTLPQKEYAGLNTSVYRDPNEKKMQQRLEALQKALNVPVPEVPNQDFNADGATQQSSMHSNDVDKLEQMMQTMNGPNGHPDPDPELQQLNGMLESILDIQHPDRVQEKLKKASQSQRGQVFAIATQNNEDPVSSLQSISENASGKIQRSNLNGFYSWEEPATAGDGQNTVEAVVHETQSLVNGTTVKLRLANAIFINGVQIPKDNFLFGVASLKGERLAITVNSIRYGNSLFPVELSVYDLDGLSGIYIPGALNREVAKESADRSMQTLGIATMDDSWGAQAAGAGIEAAKSLLSKKVKQVKVVIKAGYQVLLRDEKQKESN
jgi:conjugative transposon TraM protein